MNKERPIIALDFPNQAEIATFLAHFPKTETLSVKVGMELFYQNGPDIVKWLNSLGHEIFLDLKLHDIPNTVERAMKGIAKLGVAMTNVHAAGGSEMLKAAKVGLENGATKNRPELIAVTQLTSTSEAMMQKEQGISGSLEESVIRYAKITAEAGLDGVVCSAKEVKLIKAATSKQFLCLTPGIRPAGSDIGDQKRVMTPRAAREIGSDYIVVGRPITQSEEPYQAYQKIQQAWKGE